MYPQGTAFAETAGDVARLRHVTTRGSAALTMFQGKQDNIWTPSSTVTLKHVKNGE
jgi:hypothetical protein